MANQVTLVNSRIVFAHALSNALNGSSQGDWEISVTVFIPSGDSSNERLFGGLAAGASQNRVYFPRNATNLQFKDGGSSGCSFGDFSAQVDFDEQNTLVFRKEATSLYPDLIVNGTTIPRTVSSGSWQVVPAVGNLGENFNSYSGLTVSAFAYVDHVDSSNNMTFSFDGEFATPPISETVDGDHPSFAGGGTPLWSVVGGGSPTIDTDVQEGTPINIYTGEGLTGTPIVKIDGVPVPYTGNFPNLVVPTDLIILTDIFHGWDLDAPLVLRVEHDAGGYDNEIIIRSRDGYKRTQLMFPDQGAGTLSSLLPDITLQHNDIIYYPTANNTQVNERGYLMTDATEIDFVVGKYAENGVFWYPYRLSTSVSPPAPDNEAPTITLVGGNITLAYEQTFIEPGYSATDNRDGDLTASVVVSGDSIDPQQPGTYYLNYDVTDAAGNAAITVSRSVTVLESDRVPTLTLTGDAAIELLINTPWVEPGYTANDFEDGDLHANVIISGDVVDVSTAGVYQILYDVTDSDGNPASQQVRTVTVKQPGINALTGAVTSNASFTIELYQVAPLAANEVWQAVITVAGTDYELTVGAVTEQSITVTTPNNLPVAAFGASTLTLNRQQISE